MLHRFWFRFSGLKPFHNLRLGCEVTAYSYDDAVQILAATVFSGQTVPPIDAVIEDVDVTTLDKGHVIPNMSPPTGRGVWFPQSIPPGSLAANADTGPRDVMKRPSRAHADRKGAEGHFASRA